MSDKKIFKDDIGILFKVYAGLDLSDVTSVVMKIRKPSGTIVSWTASVDPTNSSYALYTTVADDLDTLGEHLISLSIVTTDGKQITGQSDTFTVYDQFLDLTPPNRYINIY